MELIIFHIPAKNWCLYACIAMKSLATAASERSLVMWLWVLLFFCGPVIVTIGSPGSSDAVLHGNANSWESHGVALAMRIA